MVQSLQVANLTSVIKNVLLCLNPPLGKTNGQCYDGASKKVKSDGPNKKGRINGNLQKVLWTLLKSCCS